MTASLTILFLVLMFLGMPVAFAIGISFMLFYLLGPAPAMISVQKIVVSTQNFPLLAIPLFIFAGHLMNHSGITERLIKLSTVMTGWISGGLAHVAIMLSALMGGISSLPNPTARSRFMISTIRRPPDSVHRSLVASLPSASIRVMPHAPVLAPHSVSRRSPSPP